MAGIADKLLERRTAVLKQSVDIAQKGVAESRDLTVEEEAAFDQLIAEAEALATRARAIADGDQASRDLEESFRKTTGREMSDGRDPFALGPLGTWARSARIGDGFDLKPIPGAEKRALQAVTGRGGEVESRAMSASGGIGADGVYGQLWQYAIATSQLLQAGVDIINTTDGNTLPLPAVTAHAQTSDTPTAANANLATADATLTTVNNTVQKYDYLTLVPTELVQDTVFDLEGYIARAAGRELGRRVAKIASAAAVAGFTTVGVTGPVGTTVSLGNQATAGQGSDLLIQLYHSVLPDYRIGSAWTMADPTAAIVQQLKSGTTGDTIFGALTSMGDGFPIMNKPQFVDPFLPTPAANAKSIYFGEWAALKVRIAGGLRFERSADFAFGSDQIAYRVIVRTGSTVVDPNAVKFFQHSAT